MIQGSLGLGNWWNFNFGLNWYDSFKLGNRKLDNKWFELLSRNLLSFIRQAFSILLFEVMRRVSVVKSPNWIHQLSIILVQWHWSLHFSILVDRFRGLRFFFWLNSCNSFISNMLWSSVTAHCYSWHLIAIWKREQRKYKREVCFKKYTTDEIKNVIKQEQLKSFNLKQFNQSETHANHLFEIWML